MQFRRYRWSSMITVRTVTDIAERVLNAGHSHNLAR